MTMIAVSADTISEICEILSVQGECPDEGCDSCIFNKPNDKDLKVEEV
mgnify:CR=1 FL=1